MIIQQQQSLCNSVILSIREGQVPGEPTHQLLPLAVAPTTLHHWWPTSSFRQHVQVSSPTTNAPFPTNGIVINSPIGALTVFDSTHCLKDFLPIFSHNLYVWFANDQRQMHDKLIRINQWPTNCVVSIICINWLFCIHLYTELCHFPSTNYDHHSQWTLVATC